MIMDFRTVALVALLAVTTVALVILVSEIFWRGFRIYSHGTKAEEAPKSQEGH